MQIQEHVRESIPHLPLDTTTSIWFNLNKGLSSQVHDPDPPVNTVWATTNPRIVDFRSLILLKILDLSDHSPWWLYRPYWPRHLGSADFCPISVQCVAHTTRSWPLCSPLTDLLRVVTTMPRTVGLRYLSCATLCRRACICATFIAQLTSLARPAHPCYSSSKLSLALPKGLPQTRYLAPFH